MPASPELDTSARFSPAFSRMATASPAENRSAASWLKWIWASKIGIGAPMARAAEGSSTAAAEVARKRRREIIAGPFLLAYPNPVTPGRLLTEEMSRLRNGAGS